MATIEKPPPEKEGAGVSERYKLKREIGFTQFSTSAEWNVDHLYSSY